jgi:hypothetical protein
MARTLDVNRSAELAGDQRRCGDGAAMTGAAADGFCGFYTVST